MRNSHLQHSTMAPLIRSMYFKQWTTNAIRQTIYCQVTYMSERNGFTQLSQGWMRDFQFPLSSLSVFISRFYR